MKSKALVLSLLLLGSQAFAALILTSSDIAGGSLELGSFLPGGSNYNLPAPFTSNNSSAFPGINVHCQYDGSDGARDWYLTIAGSALTNTNTGMVLPGSAFQVLPTYAQYSDSSISPQPDSNNNSTLRGSLSTTAFTVMGGTPVTLYHSSAGASYNNTGTFDVAVRVQFAVIIPGSAAPGLYTSNLTFTLTE